MNVIVNDEDVECDEQITVAGLLERLGFPEKGIAVAVDCDGAAAVASGRRRCPTAPELEVVTAVQGG